MEEDRSSIIEGVKMNVNAEASDCSSPSSRFHTQMHSKNEGNAFSGEKLKGLVPQPNGHWGAQIYANHQRIWLGTFKTEIDAAMAYDSASIKLHTGDNPQPHHRNIHWTNVTVHEPEFQSLHSTETILNMIRNGSYPSKFLDFLRNRFGEHELVGISLTSWVDGINGGFSRKLLFHKELTPSDVGKLNRLVVPKKFAIKCFPPVAENTEENMEGGKPSDVHLFFYDRLMRSWKFRYCYWKSSQSFVFTKGWNRFVKEKGLKANDIVAFYLCEGRDRAQGQSFCLIDVGYTGGSTDVSVENSFSQFVDNQVKQNLNCRLSLQEGKEEFGNQKLGTVMVPTGNGRRSVRLFGVDIN